MKDDDDGTTHAAPEHVWVCSACGKTSRTRYGFDKTDARVASRGWDESCMLHAVLCYEAKGPDGKWQAVVNEQ